MSSKMLLFVAHLPRNERIGGRWPPTGRKRVAGVPRRSGGRVVPCAKGTEPAGRPVGRPVHAIDFAWRPSYSWRMSRSRATRTVAIGQRFLPKPSHHLSRTSPRRQSPTALGSLLALVLTVAVSAAGVACACAVPALDSSEAGHGHHPAPHHLAEAASEDACLHVDCGDCSADGITTRLSASTPPPETSLDEALALTGAHLPLAPPLRASSARSPPLPLARLADSPVRRFDRMLD